MRVRDALQKELPATVAKMRLYLVNPATHGILFKPIKSNIAEAHGQIAALLQAEYTPEEGRGASPSRRRRSWPRCSTACADDIVVWESDITSFSVKLVTEWWLLALSQELATTLLNQLGPDVLLLAESRTQILAVLRTAHAQQ